MQAFFVFISFQIWSDVTPLNFSEKQTGEVDIDIRFEFRNHGDRYPFEGVGKTLAHAFDPLEGGNVHFNNEELWTVEASYGKFLKAKAIHVNF